MEHHPDLSDPDLPQPKLLLPPTEVMYANAMARSEEIKRAVQREKGQQYAERKEAARRIADALDLAVLRPTAKRRDIEAACALVNQHEIASICVASSYVPIAVSLTPRVCAVIGFPHGNVCIPAKVAEAEEVLYHGACELDVVVSYGRFLDGNPDPVVSELTQIVGRAHARRAIVKAILETCYLNKAQIADLCNLCVDCGVDYVKTSTGFGDSGAGPVAVQTMLDAVDGRCLVKASGGINDYETAKMYLDMGCTRLGSSKYLELLPVV